MCSLKKVTQVQKVDEKHDTSNFFLFQNTKSQNIIKKHSYIETKKKNFFKKTHDNYTVNCPSKNDMVNYLKKTTTSPTILKLKRMGRVAKSSKMEKLIIINQKNTNFLFIF